MPRLHRSLTLVLLIGCRQPVSSAGTVTDDAGVSVSVPGTVERIVSLIPATTELVFALGAGDRLVGRTRYCDFPPEAARVPDLGNGIDPSVEAVVAARPDLVLLYRSSANTPAAERLRALRLPVLELITDRIADQARIARLLGPVLGVAARAESLVAAVDRQIADATQPPGRLAVRPSVFLLAWNRPPLTLGRGSFLSEIVERAGARNIFDDLAAPSAPVSIEAVAVRDPDFILTSAVDLPAIAELPEWQVVRAVRERRFLRVRGSEFNRPSPRIGSAIRTLSAALDSARR
ncbi:MAG: ABC transporter substrate-binding protein [Gemmatimonadales bacterium]